MKCISCGKETSEGVKFPCAECERKIFRCSKCRTLSIEYKCECTHSGP